jgi:prepilin-type N-terminal cleavage/methylation domain-containing protein
MRNSKGFTLIEIIVAVALVAILSAAVAPSVLNNIAQGRFARAQSDVQAIASAVMRFKSDTGKYPRLANPVAADTVGGAFDFLLSDTVSASYANASAAGLWPTALAAGVGAASAQKIGSHLIFGMMDAATDSYTRAANPDDPASTGFRVGYISADQADPWGNTYMINVAALGLAGQTVWVLSAGPNGIAETDVLANGTGAAATLVGDDIGFRIQ